MDVLVGSVQILIFAAIMFPVFGRAEEAKRRKLEKPLPQSQLRLHAPRPLPQTAR